MKKLAYIVLLIFGHLIYGQNITYDVFNTSVNSAYAELGVVSLQNSKVLFASSKKDINDVSFKKNRRKNNRQLHLKFFIGSITPTNDIIQEGIFIDNENNPIYHSDITFTPDFKQAYFTWNNFYNTQSRKDSAKWRTLHIVKADINENFEISNITPLSFNSESFSNHHPFVSKNGKLLYFVSDRPGGFGKSDIYVVSINKSGTYGAPKNLGKSINTKELEIFPFVDEYNTLYFTSNGHKGQGNLDIFKSLFENNSYQKVENLPIPINSNSDDFAFVMSEGSESGFFTSTRKNGKGDADIYAFVPKKLSQKIIASNTSALKINTAKQTESIRTELVPKEIPKAPIACEQFISGLVFSTNGIQLNNVKVSLISDNEIQEVQLVEKGFKYNFKINCNQTYKIIAEKKNYYSAKIEINSTSQNGENLAKTFTLKPLKCSQFLNGSVVETKTYKPLSNASIIVFKDNYPIDTISLNTNGSFRHELNCNTEYRIVAELENYHSDVTMVSTSLTPNLEISRKLSLEHNLEFITVRGKKMLNINPINFELNESEITEDAAIELNRVVDILFKYPNLKITVNSHTDSRAPDAYNLRISKARALSIYNYIISKGIKTERIIAEGFGETQLLNNCSNGVKCSEAEHLINRRTEFIITDE